MTAMPSFSPRVGVYCMLAAMMLISVNDMLIKSLSGDYPLHQLMAMRSLIGIVLTFGILHYEGGLALFRTGRPGLHILRGLLIVFANSSMYAAIVAMPLATANALYFVAPLFVTLLSIPVLGEKVGPRRFAAIAVGFVGVLVMMAPELAAGSGGLGWVVILPVFAAAGYGTMSVLTRKLGAVSRASVLSIHMQVAFLVISAIMYAAAGDGRFITPDSSLSAQFLLRAWVVPQSSDTVAIIGLGFMSAVIGYLITQAYRFSPASVVAPFEYVLLIYALFWGWTAFGEWPANTVFVGAAIVTASGVYVFVREGRQATAPRKA
jgi:S-adenosylmethionine uptake transporter